MKQFKQTLKTQRNTLNGFWLKHFIEVDDWLVFGSSNEMCLVPGCNQTSKKSLAPKWLAVGRGPRAVETGRETITIEYFFRGPQAAGRKPRIKTDCNRGLVHENVRIDKMYNFVKPVLEKNV